jgi:hypothetical protein
MVERGWREAVFWARVAIVFVRPLNTKENNHASF